MKKKVLFCATVDFHFSIFHLPFLKWLKEQGWIVHVAAAGNMELPYVDKKFPIPIQRNPFLGKNITAYHLLKSIIEDHRYDLIHCHTPMGGVLTRLAARKARKLEAKVIYTSHGFHFFKGAPLVNWLLFYPIEKILARYTDCLITINEEDYSLAVNHHFKTKQIEHIHGVGVNTEKFAPVNEFRKAALRAKYHYEDNAFLMFYAAEFNANKNQQLLIKALVRVKQQVPWAKLLLAGDGPLVKDCRQLAERLGVQKMVDFLGYRRDIDLLLKMSDLAVASSLREELPVNIMEAMACGLPIIAVDNRGHRELVTPHQNGWLVERDSTALAQKMITLANNKKVREQFGSNSRKIILSKYSLNKILKEKSKIYKNENVEMEDI